MHCVYIAADSILLESYTCTRDKTIAVATSIVMIVGLLLLTFAIILLYIVLNRRKIGTAIVQEEMQ